MIRGHFIRTVSYIPHVKEPVMKENLSSRDTATRGHPVIMGHFIRMVSYIPHVKEPVMKGHLSCRDTFSRI